MELAELKDALTAYFADRRRSQSATKEGLEEIRDGCDNMIESLTDDESE
jgi:flagellar basal body-associated protein FliL